MSFTKAKQGLRSLVKFGIGTTGGIVVIGATMLNFIGAGNTFAASSDGTTVDISIAGGGGVGEILKETFINQHSRYLILLRGNLEGF